MEDNYSPFDPNAKEEIWIPIRKRNVLACD